ncbi:MAG: selenium-dependent molybdenum cofactor biosynthesis protein YqeB [Candidatus Krumholzibacteriia bacterium]
MPEAAELPVLFVGCGDLGTGAAHALFGAGFPVAVVERPLPLAVRRRAAFAEAARSGVVEVEGVRCRRVALAQLAPAAWPGDAIPLVTEPHEAVIRALVPAVVVDARLAKRKLQTAVPDSMFFVVLGPGCAAGRDCDAVIETLRGPDLGRVIWEGGATADTGVPGKLGGVSVERVLRAPHTGSLRVRAGIGARVRAGDVVATVGGEPVCAAVDGVLRGMLADGDRVAAGQKLGDVDPRPQPPPVDAISDKSRAVGRGVLEAVRTRFGL